MLTKTITQLDEAIENGTISGIVSVIPGYIIVQVPQGAKLVKVTT